MNISRIVSPKGSTVTQIRIMVSRHSAFYSPLIAAIAGGFLAREGLSGSYSVAPHGSTTPAEIAGGRADVGQAAVSASWAPLDRGEKPPVSHFAQINRYDGFFIAARRPDPDFTWKKLLDGRVTYVHGGQPEAMLRYALHKQGVDLDQVHGIHKPTTPEMMESFRSGEGDYFHEQGAYPQQLEREGVASIVASVGEVIGPVAFSSLAAKDDWLQSDDARRFTAAYRASREWVNTSDPAEVAKAEATFFPDMERQAVTEAIRFYQKLGSWSGDIPIEPALYDSALDVFEHSRLIGSRHPYQSVVVPPPDA